MSGFKLLIYYKDSTPRENVDGMLVQMWNVTDETLLYYTVFEDTWGELELSNVKSIFCDGELIWSAQ